MTEQFEIKKVYTLVILSLLYLTISLACDPLAFRLVSIAGYPMGSASLIYPSLYIILDMLTRIGGKAMGLRLMLLFHVFDFIFTYLLYGANFLPVPEPSAMLQAFSTVVAPLPTLFWSGIVGAIIAGAVEILLFSFVQKRISNFLLASFISTFTVLFLHNIPADYLALRYIFPDIYWQIIADNFIVGSSILLLSSSIANVVMKRLQFSVIPQGAKLQIA